MNDLYEYVTLTGIYRNVKVVPKFIRDTFFTESEVSPTSKIQFDVVKGGVQVAPFVNPRVGGEILRERGWSTQEYRPPMVAPQKVLSAEDLNMRQPGENIYINSKIGRAHV